MHPRLPASIIHGMRFGCTLAYPPSSPSSLTGCTSDAPYAARHCNTQGARSSHPSPLTFTILTHKVHIGCTPTLSPSSLTRRALDAPLPYHYAHATLNSKMCDTRATHGLSGCHVRALRAILACHACAMCVPCTCHARHAHAAQV